MVPLRDYRFTTARGLTLILVKWLDSVREERKNVQKFFGKLDRFRENIKPLTKIDNSVRSEVERLINNAFQCHLDLENVLLSTSVHLLYLNESYSILFIAGIELSNAEQT